VTAVAEAAALPLATLIRENRRLLDKALADAAAYRTPGGQDCGECDSLNAGIPPGPDGDHAALCLDCSDDEAMVRQYEQLRADIGRLP
jgi:hypothetical protein